MEYDFVEGKFYGVVRDFPIWKTLKIGKKSICLAREKVGDLGFTGKTTTKEVLDRIKEFGDLCTEEVGRHLRPVFEDHPHPSFWVAVEPTADGGQPDICHMLKFVNIVPWKRTYYSDPDVRWDLSDEIVFLLRK